MLKKGSMFGLDARIALAVFGSLSLISAAALYNSAANAKAVALLTELDNISKAINSYRADTGSDVVIASNFGSRVGVIVQDFDNDPGWSGPYFNSENVNSSGFYLGPSETRYTIVDVRPADRSSSTKLSDSPDCSPSTIPSYKCTVYISVRYTNSEKNVEQGINLFKKLDEIVDGGDGYTVGKIQALQPSNNTTIPDSSLQQFYILYAESLVVKY